MPQQHKTIEEIRTQFHAEYNAQQAEFESNRHILLVNILILGVYVIGAHVLMMYLAN